MRLSLVQMDVEQLNIQSNLDKAAHYFKEAALRGSELIAFPEMWTTGFNFKQNQVMCVDQDNTLDQIKFLAKSNNIWFSGSILFYDNKGKPVNAHFLIDNQGAVRAQYNKIHLFSLLHEDDYVAPGDHLSLVEDAPWGAVSLTVCYDIRFPEIFRAYALQGSLLNFSPMAFPHPRLEHWKILVRARAIENQFFMVGTNQVGAEIFAGDEGPVKVSYFGHSCVIDPWGTTLIEADDKEETLLSCEIDLSVATNVREKMSVLKDRREDILGASD